MARSVINVHSFLQECNPSKLIVYTSVLVFLILLSLRFDNKITLSYWLVFLPLWIWKSIAILGAVIGIIVWIKNPDYRTSHTSYIHFKSMLISLSLQLLLLMSEILICDKLETRRHTWGLAFVPLIFISLLSISVCVWSVKNNRGIELEFFAAINILQISLVAMKLDNMLNWSWIIVFIPSWILVCFAIVVILYATIFAAIVLSRATDFGADQRRTGVQTASLSSMVFVPMLVFIILLTNKLDAPPNVITLSYFFTFTPLFLTLIILIRMTFGSKPGSLWWFGMRADFCTYLLTLFPCLKEYGNISYTIDTRSSESVMDRDQGTRPHDPAPNSVDGHRADVISTRSTSNSRAAVLTPASDAQHHPTSSQASSLSPGNGGRRVKRFLSTLTEAFSRDKQCQEPVTGDRHESICPKLSIDMPD